MNNNSQLTMCLKNLFDSSIYSKVQTSILCIDLLRGPTMFIYYIWFIILEPLFGISSSNYVATSGASMDPNQAKKVQLQSYLKQVNNLLPTYLHTDTLTQKVA